MQIIGGKFKGRKLSALRGLRTRPTSGKVREAVFNICSERVPGSSVADLFAGTGAMGIEALSRGAKHVVFVEADRKSVQLIRKNLAACGAGDMASVLCRDLLGGPEVLADLNSAFDLVFMDPPYHSGAIAPVLENLAKTGSLSPGALTVIEHSFSEPLPADAEGFEIIDTRRYGKTLVSFMSYVVASK